MTTRTHRYSRADLVADALTLLCGICAVASFLMLLGSV
jgi:hypothetical protein